MTCPSRRSPCRLESQAVVAGDCIAVPSVIGRNLGVALDIGTTTIAAALHDLSTGAMLATGSIGNSQTTCGADVIERISHAATCLAALNRAVLMSVNHLLGDLLAKSGAFPENACEVMCVGNPTMLQLFLGISPETIGVAPFIPALKNAVTLPASQAGLRINPEASVHTLPLLGAYVGSDTVAGILATAMARHQPGNARLYLDIGTNVEIVLTDGHRSLCTAAPAGPAFEGPHGHCGSQSISILAGLLSQGILDSSGRLTAPACLTQKDIRNLQYAKAAVAAGMIVLLSRLGLQPGDLQEVLLAGAFGNSIDPASARAIGLVPDLPLERIRAVGNAALAGASLALLSPAERDAASRIPDHVIYVELSGSPEFNDLFTNSLAFPDTRR